MSFSNLTFSKMGLVTLGGVIGAFIMLGVMSFVGTANATTQGRPIGAYMLMQHSNPTATAGVFRVNVSTGYVSYCYIDSGAKPGVTCTPETP